MFKLIFISLFTVSANAATFIVVPKGETPKISGELVSKGECTKRLAKEDKVDCYQLQKKTFSDKGTLVND